MYTFIKLGGSVITDKAQLQTACPQIIEQITAQIQTYKRAKNETIWVLHGAGSFGHHSAQRVLALDADQQSLEHAQTVQQDVAALSAIIVQSLPSYTVVHPHTIWHDESAWRDLLQLNIRVIMHGDMLWQGDHARVVSTEEIMVRLCRMAERPVRVLLLCDTDGVHDAHGQVLPQVSQSIAAHANDHPDVTGGMAQKVREGLRMAATGAAVSIANGRTPDLVSDWLQGKKITQTQVVQRQ